jgi:hypothetical protein
MMINTERLISPGQAFDCPKLSCCLSLSLPHNFGGGQGHTIDLVTANFFGTVLPPDDP